MRRRAAERASDGSHAYVAGGWRELRWVDEGYTLELDLTVSVSGSADPPVPDGERVMSLYEYVDGYLASDGEEWCVHLERSWWTYGRECHETEGGGVVVGARTGR